MGPKTREQTYSLACVYKKSCCPLSEANWTLVRWRVTSGRDPMRSSRDPHLGLIFYHVGSGSAALTGLAVIPSATSIRRECAVRETSDGLGNPS
jgi:hypothetical protein